MKKFPFELYDEDSLITIDASIDKQAIRLALDTGASHTVIDLTALILAGYSLDKAVGTVELETAKGAVEAYLFKIKQCASLEFMPNK
jgi:predicted aspartyl protease